ncbi:MAG: hypothetical protein GMKNLPBB_00753 [Myxococcota bacterium]|nr:hypothetical protein [Myxococcota bacterium]
MHIDLVKIFQDMDLFAKSIVFVLAAMALASLTVCIERLWVFRRTRFRAREFGAAASQLLKGGQYGELETKAKDQKDNPLADLLGAGIGVYLNVPHAEADKAEALDLVERELARKREAQSARLRRGLGVLASVGSVAPFVGLLGTVVGIIASFESIATEGSGGLGVVSAGIAEALVVTALGLVVAIPAVLIFNGLTAMADSILLALDHAAGEFVDHLKAAHGVKLAPVSPIRKETEVKNNNAA